MCLFSLSVTVSVALVSAKQHGRSSRQTVPLCVPLARAAGLRLHNPANATVVEVKTIVYHSSYLPFVDANIDDNSRDLAVLALSQPIAFSGESPPPPPRAVSTGRWPRTIRLETIRDAGSQE